MDSLEPNKKSSPSSHQVQHRILLLKIQAKSEKVLKNVTWKAGHVVHVLCGSKTVCTVGQMVIDKSCANDLLSMKTICNDLLNDAWRWERCRKWGCFQYSRFMRVLWITYFSYYLVPFPWKLEDSLEEKKLILYVYFIFRMIEGSLLLLNAYLLIGQKNTCYFRQSSSCNFWGTWL